MLPAYCIFLTTLHLNYGGILITFIYGRISQVRERSGRARKYKKKKERISYPKRPFIQVEKTICYLYSTMTFKKK